MGVDPSHSKFGVGFVGDKGFFRTELIKFKDSLSPVERYRIVLEKFAELISEIKQHGSLEYIVIETPYEALYGKGRKSSAHNLIVYARATGAASMAAIAVAQDIPVVEIQAHSWVNPYTGPATKGRAAFALKALGVVDDLEGLSSDEIDAAFLAYWWLDRCVKKKYCEVPKPIKRRKRNVKRSKNGRRIQIKGTSQSH